MNYFSSFLSWPGPQHQQQDDRVSPDSNHSIGVSPLSSLQKIDSRNPAIDTRSKFRWNGWGSPSNEQGYSSSYASTIPSVTSGQHVHPTPLTASFHPTTVSVTSATSITSPNALESSVSTPRMFTSASPAARVGGAFSQFPVSSPSPQPVVIPNQYHDSDNESNHSHRSSSVSLEHTPRPLSARDPMINSQLKEIHEDLTYTPTLPQYRARRESGTSTLNRLLLESHPFNDPRSASSSPPRGDTMANDAQYANDICVPHENYSGTAPLQSTTADMDSASAVLTDDEEPGQSSLMVQLMSDDEVMEMDDDTFYIGSVGNAVSRNHLIPFNSRSRTVPMGSRIGGGGGIGSTSGSGGIASHSSQEDLPNEVQLALVDSRDLNEKEDFLSKMYGLDTPSVVSDASDVRIPQFKRPKIRVSCNNCYLWRHNTEKLQREVTNATKRKEDLEQRINDAQEKEQSSRRQRDEAKEEVERLEKKNMELSDRIKALQRSSTNVLVEERKEMEAQQQQQREHVQQLMRDKLEMETQYNEQLSAGTAMEEEVERVNKEMQALRTQMKRMEKDKADIASKYEALLTEHGTLTSQNEELSQWKAQHIQHSDLEEPLQFVEEQGLVIEQRAFEHEKRMAAKLEELFQEKLKVHRLEDELSESKAETQRMEKAKKRTESQLADLKVRSERLRDDNDKLMDSNYELNAKLSKAVEERDQSKKESEIVKYQEQESEEEIAAVRKKLSKAVSERDKSQKESVRQKNRIESLMNENKGLQESIHHLESIVEDTFGWSDLKSKELKSYKLLNNEKEQRLEALRKRMDKRSRQKDLYHKGHADGFRSHIRKKDQKLDMVRHSNVELTKSNEELQSQVNSLKVQVSEMESTIEDNGRSNKTKCSQYQSEISKLIAKNNQIVSSKLALETDLEHANDTVNTLRAKLDEVQAISDGMKTELQNYQTLEIRSKLSQFPGDRLMKLDLEADANWQFVGRCKNIFINTNKLTPKLIMQLIESTSRSISIFHQSKSRFAHCIHQNEMLSEKFGNLQSRILERYEEHPVISSSQKSEPKLSKQRSSRKRAMTMEKSNKRRVKIAAHAKPAVEVSHIRKPTIITRQQPSHHGAYEELYNISKQLVSNALHDMTDIADAYGQPLDTSWYNGGSNTSDQNTMAMQSADDNAMMDDDRVLDGEVPALDWETLSVDPKLQRYEAEESARDQERFENAYKKFKASATELRKQHAKAKEELKEAWHVYFTPTTTRSPTQSPADDSKEADDDVYAMNIEPAKIVRSFSTM